MLTGVDSVRTTRKLKKSRLKYVAVGHVAATHVSQNERDGTVGQPFNEIVRDLGRSMRERSLARQQELVADGLLPLL